MSVTLKEPPLVPVIWPPPVTDTRFKLPMLTVPVNDGDASGAFKASEVSISVRVLTVIVAAIWSPVTTVRALDDSCVRVIVSVSVEMAVTRTISALLDKGLTPVGQIVALKGGVGNLAPSPEATTSDVPDVAGEGAVATVL